MRTGVPALLVALLGGAPGARARNSLAARPPMGWMSWELFRCKVDCAEDEGRCISEWLYRNQTDALVRGGFLAAGYNKIHIDDCWMQHEARKEGEELVANASRFPSGIPALSAYMHERGVRFGLYTDESPLTCAGYAASSGHEAQDAKMFADWGVDYLKVDGCGDTSYYPTGYKAMGAALEASGRDIEYSCSWPAYLGDNESTKPFAEFVMDGCNSWRNYVDIDCNWGSLSNIIDHWGDYGASMAAFAGPGHWHDMDMLIVGGRCLTLAEEQTQMAMWAVSASPLIMGNDLLDVPESSKEVLLNMHAIAVNQDPLGQMGLRLEAFSSKSPQQIWCRHLAGGDVAVALYNKLGSVKEDAAGPACPSWHRIRDGRVEACGGGSGDFLVRGGNAEAIPSMALADVDAACCRDVSCNGFAFQATGRAVEYRSADQLGCSAQRRAEGGPADIEVRFADVNLYGPVTVFDIWAGQLIGEFSESFVAKDVPLHGTRFLRLSRSRPSPLETVVLAI